MRSEQAAAIIPLSAQYSAPGQSRPVSRMFGCMCTLLIMGYVDCSVQAIIGTQHTMMHVSDTFVNKLPLYIQMFLYNNTNEYLYVVQ